MNILYYIFKNLRNIIVNIDISEKSSANHAENLNNSKNIEEKKKSR